MKGDTPLRSFKHEKYANTLADLGKEAKPVKKKIPFPSAPMYVIGLDGGDVAEYAFYTEPEARVFCDRVNFLIGESP